MAGERAAGADRQRVRGLARLGWCAEADKPAEALVPAVPVKKSVTPEFIVCLEDGKKMKMLKRYLATRYDMTPAEYRQRWGLPADYPMVAPAYAASARRWPRIWGSAASRQQRHWTRASRAPEPAPVAAEKPARRVFMRKRAKAAE